MNLSVSNVFKNSFVLSISKDRENRFRKIIDFLQLPQPRLFEGFTNKKPIENIRNSHLAIIRKAKEENLDFCAVLEDDFYPCKNFVIKANYYLSEIPDNADILNLGVSNLLFFKSGKINYFNYEYYKDKKNSNIGTSFKFKRFNSKFYLIDEKNLRNSLKGAGYYIIFKKAYDKLLNLEVNRPIDTLLNFLENYYIPTGPLSFQVNEKTDKVFHRTLNFKSIKERIDPDEFFFKRIELP